MSYTKAHVTERGSYQEKVILDLDGDGISDHIQCYKCGNVFTHEDGLDEITSKYCRRAMFTGGFVTKASFSATVTISVGEYLDEGMEFATSTAGSLTPLSTAAARVFGRVPYTLALTASTTLALMDPG